jgi:hypothetical protein
MVDKVMCCVGDLNSTDLYCIPMNTPTPTPIDFSKQDVDALLTVVGPHTTKLWPADRRALCFDIFRHFAPLWEEKERMREDRLVVQQREGELAADRDALRTRVAELEWTVIANGKQLDSRDEMIAEKSARITALETTNKALEADKARLDWLTKNGRTLSEYDGHWEIEGSDFSHLSPRAAIDAAIAQSGGQET